MASKNVACLFGYHSWKRVFNGDDRQLPLSFCASCNAFGIVNGLNTIAAADVLRVIKRVNSQHFIVKDTHERKYNVNLKTGIISSI